MPSLYAVMRDDMSRQSDKIRKLRKENEELKQKLEIGLCPLCGARVSKCGGLKMREEDIE